MFQFTLAAELATHIGSRLEVAVDDYLVEGVLKSVVADFITLENTVYGGAIVKEYIFIQDINFVNLP